MDDYLDHLSNEICRSCNLTAVGIGVLENDNPPLISVAGRRNVKFLAAAEKDDRWHIGSITKSITATLIASQISDGLYEFETPISDLLKHIPIHQTKKQITIKQLLTHTAKFNANYSLLTRIRNPKPSESNMSYRSRIISELLQNPSSMRQSREFLYSNVGYSVAGHIAETVANLDFESLVHSKIFETCNLDSAGFGAPRGETRNDEPMGHSELLGIRRAADPFGSGFTDNGVELSAAGRVHMNLSDLLKYGQLHLSQDHIEYLNITSKNWNILHSPIRDNYACGWVKESFDWSDGPILWHNGSNTLWYALLMILPAKNLVLAFTTNSGKFAKAERSFFNAAKEITQRIYS